MRFESNGERARAALLVASVAVAIAFVAIVGAGITVTEGKAVDVVKGEPVVFSTDGEEITVTGSLNLVSHLGESVEGIDVEVWAVSISDPDAPHVLLYSAEGMALPAGGTMELPIDTTIPVESMYFVVTDFLNSVLEDAAPQVSIQVKASAEYMMGLLDAEVDGKFTISLAEPGGHIAFDVRVDDDSDFEVEITGLASWLVPSYREYAVSCPDASIRAVLDGTENGLLLSVTSDDGLLNAIRTICDAGELTVTGSDGTVMEFGGENVKTILTLFGEILDALEVGA